MIRPRRILTSAALVALAPLLLAACTSANSPRPRSAEDAHAEHEAPLRIVDATTGKAIGMRAFVEKLGQARVVYVAERHKQLRDHAAQFNIVRALYRQSSSLVVGLEAFPTEQQEFLDDWVMGTFVEAEFLERTNYDATWGYDFSAMRPLFEFSRVHHLPLIGLNANRELTKTIAKVGISKLPVRLQAEIPDLDLHNAPHRKMVERALRVHIQGDNAKMQRYYEAQVVWDERMAQSVGSALEGASAPAKMVVLAGRMHIQGGLGIPERAARRGVTPYVTVFPLDHDELAEILKKSGPPRVADYFWVHP